MSVKLEVGTKVHRLGETLRGRVLPSDPPSKEWHWPPVEDGHVRVGWEDGTITVERIDRLAAQKGFVLL